MTDTIKVEFIPPEKWWQRAKWKLLEDYTSANGEITAPKDFISDGASIPWFARRIFAPTGRYFGAAIVHDYILVMEWDWPKANQQFWEELNALGITSWRKSTLLAGVRLYRRWLRLMGRD